MLNNKADSEEAKIALEKMKTEALIRLNKLDLYKKGIPLTDEFEKGKVYVSDNDLYSMKDILREPTEKEKEMIDSIQSITKNLVYHVVRMADRKGTHTYYLMFVHFDESRWELQNMQLDFVKDQIHPVVISVDALYNSINDNINTKMYAYEEIVGFRAENGLSLYHNEIPITTRPEYYE